MPSKPVTFDDFQALVATSYPLLSLHADTIKFRIDGNNLTVALLYWTASKQRRLKLIIASGGGRSCSNPTTEDVMDIIDNGLAMRLRAEEHRFNAVKKLVSESIQRKNGAEDAR